jgi:hypothetical protein
MNALKLSTLSIAVLAAGLLLGTPERAQAGGFRLNIGGFSFGTDSFGWDNDWDDDHYYRHGRRYFGRRHRRYAKPRRRYHHRKRYDRYDRRGFHSTLPHHRRRRTYPVKPYRPRRHGYRHSYRDKYFGFGSRSCR